MSHHRPDCYRAEDPDEECICEGMYDEVKSLRAQLTRAREEEASNRDRLLRDVAEVLELPWSDEDVLWTALNDYRARRKELELTLECTQSEVLEKAAMECESLARNNNAGAIGTPEDWALEANAMRWCATAIRALKTKAPDACTCHECGHKGGHVAPCPYAAPPAFPDREKSDPNEAKLPEREGSEGTKDAEDPETCRHGWAYVSGGSDEHWQLYGGPLDTCGAGAVPTREDSSDET